MHDFYKRVNKRFSNIKKSRASFCREYGISTSTLKNFWGSDKLPSGEIIEKLCFFLNESSDFLLFGNKRKSSNDPIFEKMWNDFNSISNENKYFVAGIIESVVQKEQRGEESRTDKAG